MIEHHLDPQSAILQVRPKHALEKADFEQLAASVDPFIAEQGKLAGLILETTGFPGWESLGAMAAHFRFVRDHHRHIRKVAVVSDSPLGSITEKLASHFVAAEFKQFPTGAVEAARWWILSGSEAK